MRLSFILQLSVVRSAAWECPQVRQAIMTLKSSTIASLRGLEIHTPLMPKHFPSTTINPMGSKQ
jgi:hypothetical protein